MKPIYQNGLVYCPPLEDQTLSVVEDDPFASDDDGASDAIVNTQIDAVLAATEGEE